MRQQLRALERAIGDRDRLRVLRGEMRGAELDHLAGADEQHVLAGQAAEDALRHPHGGGRHRYRLGADLGRAAHFLGYREGALEQVIQHQAEPAGTAGEPLSLLHLAQDLGLAQHHRIQAAGDAERVPNRARLRQHIGMAPQFVQAQLLFRRDEFLQRQLGAFRLVRGTVQLGAVASRDDRRLRDPATGGLCELFPQPADRRADLLGHEGDALPHRQRGGAVIQAKSQELHG